MNYEIKTAGEPLGYFIQDRILSRKAWNKFASAELKEPGKYAALSGRPGLAVFLVFQLLRRTSR